MKIISDKIRSSFCEKFMKIREKIRKYRNPESAVDGVCIRYRSIKVLTRMGSTASISMISSSYTENTSQYHNSELRDLISSIFIKNMEKYRREDMTEQEFQQDIKDILRQCEPRVIEAIQNYKVSQNCDSISDVPVATPATRPNTFLCCVDGSDASDLAYKTMIHLRRKFDQIILFHAYSLEKEKTIPPGYRSHFIRERYESQLIPSLPSSRYHFLWIERINESAFEVLSKCVEASQNLNSSEVVFPTSQPPDFIFLGYTGRKGPKEQSSTMGNTVKSILNRIPISCIIVKAIPSNPLSHR